MALSLITTAQLTPGGKQVTVSGPINLAQDEAGTDVLGIHFVLVRRSDFAHGTTDVSSGASGWSETVDVFGEFSAGDEVQGFGVVVLLGAEDQETKARIVQAFTWSEQVSITGG